MTFRVVAVHAEGNITGASLSNNSIHQKSVEQSDQEDVDEVIELDPTEDGQLLYVLSESYNNMEVMTSSIIKLQYVQVVLLTMVLGCQIAFGVVDHFTR